MPDTAKHLEAKVDYIIKLLEEGATLNVEYLTAKETGRLIGLDHRTVINRSNLPEDNPRYIPSVKLRGSRRKYFERKVIDRLFSIQ